MSEKLKEAKGVKLVEESKAKVKTIKFNNPQARAYLMTLELYEHMFTVRSKRIEGIRKVNNSDMYVGMNFVKEIEICRLRTGLLVTEPFKALEPYVVKSGFHEKGMDKINACMDWLRVLDECSFQIPQCRETRTFYLLKATKI